MLNWRIHLKLALFLLILFKVKIISRKLAFASNFFLSLHLYFQILVKALIRVHMTRHLTDACLFQGESLLLKQIVNGILPSNHGISEVRRVLLLLKIILENDSYQIIKTCHCTYKKRKWNTLYVKDSILFFCFMIETTKHLTHPINGTILHCHASDC